MQFRIYHNRTPSIKETVLDWLSLRQKRAISYSQFFALKDINLRIESGDRLGIIGRNGAGKSTMLKSIAGIYPLQEGEIYVQGRVTPLIELGTGFNYELSGRQNIYLNGAMLGMSPQSMKEKEAEIIGFAELDDFIDTPVKYYSSGMSSRLAFAIATSIQPEILLLDEVFSTGDAHFVKKAIDRMNRLFESSKIVIVVSHNLSQIMALCNSAIVLNKGQIVMHDTPEACITYYSSITSHANPTS